MIDSKKEYYPAASQKHMEMMLKQQNYIYAENTRSDEKKMSKKDLGCLTVIVVIVLAIIAFPVINFTNDHKYTVTITDKERVTVQFVAKNNNTNSKYLIYGEDENGKTYVFEDTDTLFRWKFNSSDVYGALKEGETYELTVIGFRVHILNWYENIIDFKAVK